ncbi:MAG: DUF4231 domain-containing protein [Bacteroidales bacterium]|nr:DUF4231 domain-containing protein [Bacteroidales bacterium]
MIFQLFNRYFCLRRQSQRNGFETENCNLNFLGLYLGIGRKAYRAKAREQAIKNGDVEGYIDKRWRDQREFFSNKSAKMKSIYQRMQIWIIVLSAISAAVLAINFDEVFGTIKMEGEAKAIITDKWFNNRIVCALLTMLVVVLTSIDKFMQYREEWIKNRKASERLKREYCLYRLGAGEYEKTEKKTQNADNDNQKDGNNDDDAGTESSESPKPQLPNPPSLTSFAFANVTIENAHRETTSTQHISIDELRAKYENDIEALNSKHQKDVEELKVTHQKEMDEEKANSKKQIEDFKEEFLNEIDSINTEYSKEIERRIGYFNLLVDNLKKIEESAESNQEFLDNVDEIQILKEKVKNNCSDCFKKLFDEIKELVSFADTYKELLDNLCNEVSKNQKEAENNKDEVNKKVAERLKSLFDNYKKLIKQAETSKNLLCDLYNRITKQKAECENIVQDNCNKMFKKIDNLVEASHLDKKLLGKISKEISAFQNGEGDFKLILHLNSNNVYYKTGLFLSRIRRINKEADGFLHKLQEAIVNEIENFETMEDYFAINDRTAYFLQRVNEIAVHHKNGPGRYKCYRRLTEEISNYVRSDGEYSSFEDEELSSSEKKLVDKLSFIAENDKFWLNRHFYYRDIQAVIIEFKLQKGDFADKKSDGDNSNNKLDYRDLVFVNNTEGIIAEDVDDFIARKIALANFEEQLDKIIERKLGRKGDKKDNDDKDKK